ncbi:MAG: glycoside hydrolase family 20 zincin-like fold domain-containing protein [Armatimonadota bacterium]
MTTRMLLWGLAAMLGAQVMGMAAPRVSQVSGAEAAAWVRWAIPLPKEVKIARKVELAPAEVGIRLRSDAGPAERTAADQLEALFVQRAGIEPRGSGFRIVIGVCDQSGSVRGRAGVIDPARLRALPNSDQAYAIVPLGNDELVLTALTEAGVYYATQTLRQMLEATLTAESVAIPLMEVLDWPDLAERGEWGGSANSDIEWMAAHKMNLVETHVTLTVEADGTPVAQAPAETIALGRRNALKVVPIITHLDHLLRTGIYQAYPQLIGVGYDLAHLRNNLVAPCASKPEFIDVLAGWMDGLSRTEGVTDICAWLSEIEGMQCGCDECKQHSQYALEARAYVQAWRRNREAHPHVGLRILLTQGSYPTNDQVLAEIPPEVGVTYYDGGRTYDSSREEMIYPLLEEYAAKGGWLGCYPQLTASWRIVCPWTGPQFIHYRMNEFVDDGLSCLCGYATPDNRCYEFNVLAAAEWSWNAKGRSPREFAAAWATRKGFADPDAVAQWAMRMGEVGWDLYGSRVPFSAFFGSAATYVKQRAVPSLGTGMYRYFPTQEHLDAHIATCEWAEQTALGWDAPLLVHEARVVGGMLRMLRGIRMMTLAMVDAELAPEEMRARLSEEMFAMALAGQQATQGLRDWRDAIEGWTGAARLDDTIEAIDRTVADIGVALAAFGVEDPGRPYRLNTIGTWTSSDFEPEPRIEKQFEVTDLLTTPGTWSVGFRYESGWHGLTSFRVALLSAPRDRPDDLTEVAVDEHRGVAAVRNEANIYTLEVTHIDPDRRYFVRVDIQGVSDVGQPSGRTGCEGTVWMRLEGEIDAAAGPPPLRPLTDEQAAAFGPPRFTTERPHIGVLPAGYGSSAILSWLRRRPEVEALPMARISPAMLAPCDAAVVAQPRTPDAIGDAAVAVLRDYVAGGGGLVVTHDAAGFRGLPAIIPEVCAGGIDKTAQTQWVAIAEHPVTAGIALDMPQPQGYYDQIQLRPGPDGMVLARSAGDDNAVVIAGEFGAGRYVAIGLAVGLSPDTQDTEPEGAEAQLLLNAVTWAAG